MIWKKCQRSNTVIIIKALIVAPIYQNVFLSDPLRIKASSHVHQSEHT